MRLFFLYILLLFACKTAQREPLSNFLEELESKISKEELLEFKQEDVFQVIRSDVHYFDTELYVLYQDPFYYRELESFFDTLYEQITFDSISATIKFMLHDRLNEVPYSMDRMMREAKSYRELCNKYWSDHPILKTERILGESIISQLNLDTISSKLPIKDILSTDSVLVRTLVASSKRVSIYSDSFCVFQLRIVDLNFSKEFEVDDTLIVRVPLHRIDSECQ